MNLLALISLLLVWGAYLWLVVVAFEAGIGWGAAALVALPFGIFAYGIFALAFLAFHFRMAILPTGILSAGIALQLYCGQPGGG